jgi:hypothetical protein
MSKQIHTVGVLNMNADEEKDIKKEIMHAAA